MEPTRRERRAARLSAGRQALRAQPLNWAKDDGSRVETLKKSGSRLEGEHVILWFPQSLAHSDAEKLIKRLDAAVADLWRQAVRNA